MHSLYVDLGLVLFIGGIVVTAVTRSIYRDFCKAKRPRVYSPEENEIFSREQQARNKQVAEMKWYHLGDLPGYDEWFARYHGIERVLPDLKDNRVLVHPDEFGRSFDEKFAQIAQSWLEEMAERGGPRKKLEEYRTV